MSAMTFSGTCVKDSSDLEHIVQNLKSVPAPLILDVGANFGYYSIMLASLLGERVRVCILLNPIPVHAIVYGAMWT